MNNTSAQTTASAPATNNQPRIDLYQKVTDTIIQHLEEGTMPWQKPWKGGDSSFKIPLNQISGKQYNGVNILLLWGAAIKHEYSSNVWASFRQWSNKKESIRKGEKGTMVVYYDFLEKEVEGELKKLPFLKSYVVFNQCQLASYDPGNINKEPEVSLAERLDEGEGFLRNTGAVIKHKGKSAFYNFAKDEIVMPKMASFIDTDHSTATENYYSTLLHELVHWTGHESRLKRDFGKRFGDYTYAAEELVAEFGAAFLCSELGISREPRKDHASYIANWLTALKNNKYILTTSATAASKAVDYLNSLQPVI